MIKILCFSMVILAFVEFSLVNGIRRHRHQQRHQHKDKGKGDTELIIYKINKDNHMTKTTCHKRHCIDSNIGIHRRMIRRASNKGKSKKAHQTVRNVPFTKHDNFDIVTNDNSFTSGKFGIENNNDPGNEDIILDLGSKSTDSTEVYSNEIILDIVANGNDSDVNGLDSERFNFNADNGKGDVGIETNESRLSNRNNETEILIRTVNTSNVDMNGDNDGSGNSETDQFSGSNTNGNNVADIIKDDNATEPNKSGEMQESVDRSYLESLIGYFGSLPAALLELLKTPFKRNPEDHENNPTETEKL